MSTPAVVAALSLTQSAKANPIYWDVNGATAGGSSTTTAAGTWDTSTTNWGLVADGTGTPQAWTATPATPLIAVFSAGTNVTGASTVTVSGTINNIDGITFEEGTVTLSGGILTLEGTGATGTINAGVNATISGVIDGTIGMIKSGAGTLVLSGVNTYTGLTRIDTGTLQYSADTALGNAANGVQLNGGTLSMLTGYNSTRGLDVAANGGLTVATGQTMTWSGAITGTATIAKAGAGTLVITNAANSAYGLSVNAGTVIASNGTLSGATTVAGGTLLPGGTGTVDALSLSSFTFTSGAMTMDLNGLTNDALNMSGALTLTDGAITFNPIGAGITSGNTYTLMTYTGALTGLASNIEVFLPSGFDSSGLVDTGSAITITPVASTTGPASWVLNANGGWSAATNWTTNPSVPSGTDATVTFGGAISAARTVTIDGSAKRAGTVRLEGSNSYTLAGPNSLIMSSTTTASIDAAGANHTISAPIVLENNTNVAVDTGLTLFTTGAITGTGTLTKTGAGQLFFGVKPAAGAVSVTGGSVRSTLANMPSVTNNSTGAYGVVLRDTASATYTGVISGSGNILDEFPAAAAQPIHTYNANNTFTGTLDILGGHIVQLGGSGRFSGASNTVAIGTASALRLNNGTNNTDRLANTGTVKINGGFLEYVAHATSASTETIGKLEVGGGGQSYLTMVAGAATSTITATDYQHDTGGTLLIRGGVNFGTATTGATQLKITNSGAALVGGGGSAGTPTISIIPSMFVDNTAVAAVLPAISGTAATLATYDTNGVRQLAASEYATTITSGSSVLNNVAPTGAVSVTDNTTINALEFGGTAVAGGAGSTITTTAGKTLTLNAGVIYHNATASSTITGGTLAFGSGGTGEAIINVNSTNSATLTIASTIQGSSLTKEGANELILTGSNNFTGTTYLNRGRLTINANNRLGSAVVVGDNSLNAGFTSFGNYSGSLRLNNSTGLNYSIPLTLQGGTSSTSSGSTMLGQLDSNAGTNTWSGNITLTGQGVNGGDRVQNVISVATGSTLILSGVIQSAPMAPGGTNTGVLVAGNGTTVLTGSSPNTFDGLFRWNGGTIVVEKDGAFGTTNPLGIDDNVLMNGGTANTIAFRAPASSPAGFNYSQNEWIFTNGGGTDPAGSTSLGLGNLGVLANISGANTFAGGMGFGNAGATAPFGLNKITTVAGSLELSGIIAQQGTGTRKLDKWGVGDLILSGNNNDTATITAQTFAVQFSSGALLNINQGRVLLGGSNASGGNLPAAFTSILVARDSSLVLDNSLAVNSSRLASGTAVNLAGLNAELKLVGNASTGVTQSVGNISVASFSTVTAQATGAGITELQLPGTSRSNRGTVLLRGMDNVTSKINLASVTLRGAGGAGSLISILPEAVGDTSPSGTGTDFVTVVPGTGGYARVLTAGEYIPLASGNTTYDNTTATGTVNISADTTVNSVKLGSTISIGSGKSLYVYSGALLGVGTSPSLITGGTLTFNQTVADIDILSNPIVAIDPNLHAEGIITVPTGSTLTIASAIDGADGLTKSGGGTLLLTGTNTFATPSGDGIISGFPAVTGGLVTVNSGRLEFNVDTNLGYSAAPIFINGGTLAPLSTSTSARNVTLASLGTNSIDTGSGADFTVTGLVSGNALTKDGAGTLTLTNTGNTYTGGTIINGGTMPLVTPGSAAHNELGTGSVTLAGGSILAADNTTFDKSISVTNTSNTTAGIYVATGKTLTYGGSSTSTVGITGSGNLALDGGGRMILAKIAGSGFGYNGTYYVQNGSTLEYQDNGAATPNINAGIGAATLSGIQWNLSGGSTLRFNLPSNPAFVSNTTFTGPSRGLSIGTGGGTVDITGSITQFITNGILTGTGAFTKEGAGEYSLRANSTAGNPGFTGTFIINAGSFTTSDQNLSIVGGNEIVLGTVGALDPNWMQIKGGAEFAHLLSSGAALNLSANRGIHLLDGMPILGSSGTLKVSGVISSEVGVTGLQIDARGSGNVTLAGANTYSGNTLIKTVSTAGGSASTLRMGVANALPSATEVHFNAQTATGAAILDLGNTGSAGFDQTVAAIIDDNPGVGSARVTNSGNTAATLNINNATTNTWTGNLFGVNLNVGHSSAGTLVLTGTGNDFGGLDGTGVTQIGDGVTGITTIASHYRQGTLNVMANSTAQVRAVTSLTDAAQSATATSRINTLSIGTNAKLDLNTGKLISSSSVGSFNNSNPGAYDGILGQIQQGRNGGTTGGNWNGAGIITSQSAAAVSNYLTTLAVATAAEVKGISGAQTALFGGQTVSATDSLVMYTWTGDANLSGNIDADDYFQIDSNYGKTADSVQKYYNGDFNYSGTIDSDDYFLIDSNYSAQGSAIAQAMAGFGSSGGTGGLAGVVAVPEPGTFAVVSLAALSCLGRRRRK